MPTKDSGKPASRRRSGAATTGSKPSSQTPKTQKGAPPSPKPSGLKTTRRRSPRAAEVARARGTEGAQGTALEPAAPEPHVPPIAAPETGTAPLAEPATVESLREAPQPPSAAQGQPVPKVVAAQPEPEHDLEMAAGEERSGAELTGEELPREDLPRRRERRGAGTNALGAFIERQFASSISPAHSYSDLERRSGISREALSRYVTARADRRRSPTIDTLVAIADALHVSLEAVARAAAASVKGVIPPPDDVEHVREEALGALVAALSDEQFSAVVELLRQLRPPLGE